MNSLICFGTLSLLLLLKTVVTQTNSPCHTFSLQGVCVSYSECEYTNGRGDFITSEFVVEITNRSSACSSYGSALICCEKVISVTSATSEMPAKTTTRMPTQKTTKLRRSTTTRRMTTKFQNITPKTSTGSPVAHINYKFFKNLNCGLSSSNRLANGNNSAMNEFPWAALLGYEAKLKESLEFSCGGSIISEFYVLTAAHCLSPYLKSYFTLKVVRLGEYDQKQDPDCDDSDPDDIFCANPVQDVQVKSSVAHPGFDQLTKLNDIGIVQLNKPANFKSKSIKPICLPFNLNEIPDKFIAIGWGRISDDRTQTNSILQKANLPFYDRKLCSEKISDLLKMKNSKENVCLTDLQFCAGGEGKTDTCKGDSGSPLQAGGQVNNKPRIVQYGIVSYGVNSCGELEGYPGIYTTVSKYLNWILDNMQ